MGAPSPEPLTAAASTDPPAHVACRFRVRWTECDPAGIAFYPRFFEMLEAGAHTLAHAVGLAREDMLYPSLLGFTAGRIQADFLAPARFEDDLEVRTWVTRIGQSSVGIRHEIHRLERGTDTSAQLLVRAREDRVLVGRGEHRALRPRPIDASMRAALDRYLAPDEPAPPGT